MPRLRPLLIAIWSLLLVISSSSHAEASCSDGEVTECANLGNISAPFWPDADCAASSSFVVSNCTSKQAYWDAFTNALSPDSSFGPPKLIGVRNVAYYTFINLTWASDEAPENECPAPNGTPSNESSHLPTAINLTSFAGGLLEFSRWSYFLLFECEGIEHAVNVTVESQVCATYKTACPTNSNCSQWKPFQEFSPGAMLQKYKCSSFQFYAAATDSDTFQEWNPAAIQLRYVNPECQHCMSTGTCSSEVKCQCSQELCPSDCKSLKCNKAAIIGVSVSVVLFATIIIMIVLFLVCRKSRYSTRSFSTRSSNHLVTQRAYLLSKKFGPVAAREFSFETLSKATNNFSENRMIGDGGFGAVYLGILKDDRKCAIKRLYHDNFKRMDHFYNETQILSKLNHPNLVKLYGFCCQDSNDLLLVFEYAAGGTVSEHIHDMKKTPMPWKTRLSILRETAEALSYLHNFVKPPIYHRDVKTTNILLDGNLHAKLADFGLSRLVPLEATHVSTAPQGTPGYLDPDYHQCYQLTDKSDVYSFGVVLVELVSAKLAVDMSRDRREINLSSLALMRIGCGMWQDLVDPYLEIEKNPEIEMAVKRVLELSFMCLNAEKDSRPTMKYVAESLSNLCKELGYDDECVNEGSLQIEISPVSFMDETKHLMRETLPSKSRRAASLTPLSSDWSSAYSTSSSGL